MHAFEEQIGSHGGLGGPQNRPFLLHPRELAVPQGELTGAEAVHDVLRGWLEPAGGPSDPIGVRVADPAMD